MANHQSTKKRMRQNVKRREINRSSRSRLRTQIKKLRDALAANDKDLSQTELVPTISLIDKMVNKKILHQNTAARYKSRLTKHVNELA
ncbi:MAG: 30S ribosomal protein S20 [Aridibacter sp.]|jgi:small subunit ribosomal protein S20|nr:30S ribosomal protein S20 [Acidobacteriota bacterium]